MTETVTATSGSTSGRDTAAYYCGVCCAVSSFDGSHCGAPMTQGPSRGAR
jgi:hypothetical protein